MYTTKRQLQSPSRYKCNLIHVQDETNHIKCESHDNKGMRDVECLVHCSNSVVVAVNSTPRTTQFFLDNHITYIKHKNNINNSNII